MRKVVIALAAAGSALAFATPAAAQYFPQPQPYIQGYGVPQPYGPAYGFHNNYGQVHALQRRIDRIESRIERLRARRMISRHEANGLRSEAFGLERRLRRAASYGLNYREAQEIQFRIARLEQHVRHEVRDGRRYGRGYNSGYFDRDRDGRDDRFENDRGWDHDD